MVSGFGVDSIVVGGGFAGMYELIKLREIGLRTLVFERGPEVGGTWYWNRYPGARCDITSLDYSYSFDEDLQQEWEWSEKFATQPEILKYAQHVAERFDLSRDMRFQRSVVGARWDEEEAIWYVDVAESDVDGKVSGEGAPTECYRAKYLIFAVGNLSATNIPNIPGLNDFAGRTLHSAEWPHKEVDFSGRRVAIIGTGSSGTQIIPLVAENAEHLTVLHRTPNFSLPANNRPLTEAEVAERKKTYAEYREQARHSFTGVPVPVPTQSVFDVSDKERERIFEEAWNSGRYGELLASFTDLSTDDEANGLASEFIRRKVRDVIKDPSISRVVEPRGNYFGTKRSCLDSNYYQTFVRDNVSLIDLNAEPIERIVANGIKTEQGVIECDDLILATGFDAMTGSILAINPVGVGGIELREAWSAGPYTFLGAGTHRFPNLFFITGPGSPSVLSNMIISIEQHVEWVTDLIADVEQRGARSVQPSLEGQMDWMQTVHDEAAATLYLSGNSWYLGANITGKPRVFMPYVAGVGKFRSISDEEAHDDYPHLLFDENRRPPQSTKTKGNEQ
ncbi:flavin-containing monooxygenase [Brevibacterium aurantiacum]|uniref:flavin-containing monooxygenase n=1 Tax=Brevibacterium aurantiacum TaxID=273384 RepID=UPI00186836AD|nr:NAD(P)/FAD-dependent oxidoreductase [Brevibacterium aurantiacum]